MTSPSLSLYKPLPTKTSIRVLLLAPVGRGSPDDEIFCWLLPIDLDADHKLFPSSPQPVDSISVATGRTPSGEERNFLLPFDVYISSTQESPPMHPFQRYTALSYVWGDVSDPAYIILDGEKTPVTRNLHAALKSLRKEREGVRLWVDALCINQSDFEEKKNQIGLMGRVYRQAEKVVAYLPLSEVDQENLRELVGRIWDAKRKYDEKSTRNGSKEELAVAKEESKEKIGLIPIPDLEPRMLDRSSDSSKISDGAHLQSLQRSQGSAQFLEDFGLPPVDSPLWGTWRRFFAAPYFRRIWILQEFALASTLLFCFGRTTMKMEPIIIAYHFVKEYSGVINAHYLGHAQDGDEEGLTERALRGALGAEMMFLERAMGNGGKGVEGLLGKLKRGRGFEASDDRDKVYALLGLASDGERFGEQVSYEPEETAASVFTRFASLFVKEGKVFEVLREAGLGSSEKGLPSWVPNWTTPSRNMGTLSPNPNQTSQQASTVKILPDNKLSIPGTLEDSITHLSAPFTPPSQTSTPAPGGNLSDFMRALVKSFLLILKTVVNSEKSFAEAMEAIFQLLIQKPPSNPSSEESEEIKSLRTGFGACLGMLKAWATNLGEMEEGKMLVIDGRDPGEAKCFNAFLQRALQTTAHGQICVTEGGGVGLVLDGAEVGDWFVEFRGAGGFVVRKAARVGEANGREEGEGDEEWRLVGSGCLLSLGGNELDGEGEERDIVLI